MPILQPTGRADGNAGHVLAIASKLEASSAGVRLPSHGEFSGPEIIPKARSQDVGSGLSQFLVPGSIAVRPVVRLAHPNSTLIGRQLQLQEANYRGPPCTG